MGVAARAADVVARLLLPRAPVGGRSIARAWVCAAPLRAPHARAPPPPHPTHPCADFQWSPEHNENSASHNVKAGDELYGSITYRADTDSYDVYHKSLADNWDVSMNIPVQKVKGTAKNYTIAYFVYEKVRRLHPVHARAHRVHAFPSPT